MHLPSTQSGRLPRHSPHWRSSFGAFLQSIALNAFSNFIASVRAIGAAPHEHLLQGSALTIRQSAFVLHVRSNGDMSTWNGLTGSAGGGAALEPAGVVPEPAAALEPPAVDPDDVLELDVVLDPDGEDALDPPVVDPDGVPEPPPLLAASRGTHLFATQRQASFASHLVTQSPST